MPTDDKKFYKVKKWKPERNDVKRMCRKRKFGRPQVRQTKIYLPGFDKSVARKTRLSCWPDHTEIVVRIVLREKHWTG